MKKLYEKSPIWFALIWIALYVLVMNIALQCCGGLDDLPSKQLGDVAVPTLAALVLAAASTAWIVRNGKQQEFGLCAFRGNARQFLWFIPLVVLTLFNSFNGWTLPAGWALCLMMAANMAIAGYVEEIIFRGFLFRAMARDNVRSAIIVSGVTFGAGHIVNLGNTEDTLGVVMQIGYAMVIGILFALIVWKGGSLIPCIACHMLLNGSSVFAAQEGPFTRAVTAIFGTAEEAVVSMVSAAVLVLLAGAYALWVWKRCDERKAA